MKRFLFILLIMLLSQAAIAQSSTDSKSDEDDDFGLFDDDVEVTPTGWDQFSVSAGVISLSADGRYNLLFPSGRQVTVLNLDRLGLDDDDSSYWVAFNYRSKNSKWGSWFGTWQYDVAGFRVWEDELTIDDDVVVPVGAGVVSELAAEFYVLEATYSFYRTRDFDIGTGFGVHAVDLKTTLAGSYRVGEEREVFIREEISTLAPLPNLVGYLYWKFAPRWSLVTRLGWFGLSYDKYDGKMTNLHAKLSYDLSEHWNLAAGYSLIKLDVDVDEDDFTEVYDIDFMGPSLTLRYNF